MIHTVLRICPSSVFSTHSFSFLKVTFFLTGQFSFSPFRKNHVAFSVWRPSSLFQSLFQCRLRITIVADKECNLSFCNNFFFLFYVFLFNWNLEWFTYINKSLKAKSAPLFLPSLKKGKLKLYNSPLIKLWKQRRLILHTRKFGYNFQIDT